MKTESLAMQTQCCVLSSLGLPHNAMHSPSIVKSVLAIQGLYVCVFCSLKHKRKSGLLYVHYLITQFSSNGFMYMKPYKLNVSGQTRQDRSIHLQLTS